MSGADRYATTAAIRDATKGRETDILDSLGIRWRDGKPHIACPYPEHVDKNPSWRWDERKARAYCTCIEGSHSILDVLIKVESTDCDAAKIRAAELLKRPDLIRVRKKRGGGRDIPPDQHRNSATPAGCTLMAYAEAKRLPVEFLLSLGLRQISYQRARRSAYRISGWIVPSPPYASGFLSKVRIASGGARGASRGSTACIDSQKR